MDLTKNLIEKKHTRRLLIEGNVLENEWADAGADFAFVLKSEANLNTPWPRHVVNNQEERPSAVGVWE